LKRVETFDAVDNTEGRWRKFGYNEIVPEIRYV
jgi:hypothetical protein